MKRYIFRALKFGFCCGADVRADGLVGFKIGSGAKLRRVKAWRKSTIDWRMQLVENELNRVSSVPVVLKSFGSMRCMVMRLKD